MYVYYLRAVKLCSRRYTELLFNVISKTHLTYDEKRLQGIFGSHSLFSVFASGKEKIPNLPKYVPHFGILGLFG